MHFNRTFIPGSEWLYFKIYTGTKTADFLLKYVYYPWIRELQDKTIVDQWFFIRYSDPDFHIRIRMHLIDSHNFTDVFQKFHKVSDSMVHQGLVWKIQCDTYEREIERYGIDTIQMAERCFHIDSEAIVDLLIAMKPETIEEQLRWIISLLLIDSVLTSFSFNDQKRKEFFTELSESYKKRFGFTHHEQKKQLDAKFRTHKSIINNCMEAEETGILPVHFRTIIKKRQFILLDIARQITEIINEKNETRLLNSIISGIIHMTMNRLFRSKANLYELVIYDFMHRYYVSKIARNDHKIKKENGPK